MKALKIPAMWIVFGGAVTVAIPTLAGGSAYFQYMIEVAAIYVLASAGLNIAIGFAGQYQLAQGAVMASAAYALAFLHLDHGWSLASAIAASMFLALSLGSVVAFLSTRLSSHYLLLGTFGIQIITIEIITALESLTGGVGGRLAVTQFNLVGFNLVGATVKYSMLLIAVAIFGLLVCHWIKLSYFGLGVATTRQSERVAQAAGLYYKRFKFLAVLISTAFAAVVGIFVGPVYTYLVPGSFGITITLLLLIIVIVGGAGSIFGVAVAAIILAIAAQVAQSATTIWPLAYGLFIMIVLTITSRGLAGVWKQAVDRLLRGSAEPEERVRDAAETVSDATTSVTSIPPPDTAEGDKLALEVDGVRKDFGRVVALEGVSLSVVEGSVHGLAGPNGSGKTTLFEILSGFVSLDAGSIIFTNREISKLSSSVRARLGLGRSFQLASILPDSTVLENVLLGELASMSAIARLRMVGTTHGEHLNRAEEALSIVGLLHLRDQQASSLAYGQKKLLDMARVIVARPSLVLLDEPLAGVDSISAEFVRRAIAFFRGSSSTVIVIEHNMRFLMEFCDRVTILDAGQVLVTGTPREVSTHPDVVRSYLGERRGTRQSWRKKQTAGSTADGSAAAIVNSTRT